MQTQVEKGALLGKLRSKMVSRTIRELTPLGARLEINGEGQFVGGKFEARHLETINVFQKMDGTFEWETKLLDTTAEGDVLVGTFKGTGKATGPSSIWGEGEGIYMTQSPKLAWLNGVKAR